MSSDMSSTEHSDHSPSTVPVGGDELSTHTSIVMGNLADTGAANELQQAELGGDTMSPPDFDVSEVELQELSDLSASSSDAPMQVPLSAGHGDHDDLALQVRGIHATSNSRWEDFDPQQGTAPDMEVASKAAPPPRLVRRF